MKTVGAILMCALVATIGCRFEGHQDDNNKKSDVKFATPFGGVSVKKDQKSAQAGVGLSPYPGAVLNHKGDDGKEDGAASVNLSFGNFHLGVRALSFQSADAPDKVLAFYRKDMAKYGAIIQCHGRHPVGQPERTAEGLTCDSDDAHGKKVYVNETSGEDQLKAGSKLHQHVVSVEPRNGGTKIGLVALDLPGNLDEDDSKD